MGVKSDIEKALSKRLGGDVVTDISTSASKIKHWFTTGIAPLDVILSGEVGKGFPSGRVCELFGEEHVGKTTLGMQVIRHAQQAGHHCLLIDTESRFTESRAKKLGVNTEQLTVLDEEYLEPILDAILDVVEAAKEEPMVIFWDTIAATKPKREKGCNVGEYMIGSHARPLHQGFRRLAKPLAKSNVLLLACNQLTEGGIGKMFATEREKEGTIGGKAAKFYGDVRVKLYGYKKQSVDRRTVGFEVTAKAVKATNNVSDSYCRLSYDFLNGGNWDATESLIKTLIYWKALEMSGSRIVWLGKKIKEDDWRKSYQDNQEFRDNVNGYLAAQYLKIFALEEE